MKHTRQNGATWSIAKDRHVPQKSPFWFACFRDEHGRRTRRSTKTTDQALAEEIAMKWAQLAQSGRAGRLTESQCRNVISQMYERVVGEPLHFRTTRTYLAEWVENTRGDVDHRTYLKYYQAVHLFLKHLGVKADRLLREITPTDVRSWRDSLKAKGLSAPTVNGALTILRMPFKAAHDLGFIDINPCATSAVRVLRDEARNVSKDVFTPEQIAALLRAAPSEDWRGMILCGYFTGLRLRDCSELRWSNVNLDRSVIIVTTQKTKKDVTVPIHPQFGAWLKNQTRGIGKAPVFPSLSGQEGGGRNGLSMQFKRIMERAGIRGRILREAVGAGRKQSSLTYHSLRHSMNSALANAGVGVELRQQLIGHSSLEMNLLYRHPDVEILRQAVMKVPHIPDKKSLAVLGRSLVTEKLRAQGEPMRKATKV
jgi:integrase